MSEYAPTMRDARIDVAAVFSAVGRRLPRIIIITLLVLAAAFLVLMMMPRLYESSASILVEPRSNVYARSANEQAPSSTAGDASVVSSQIELIKSRDTLLGVIDKLDLRSKPEFNGSQSGFSPLGVIMQLIGRSSTPVSVDERVMTTLYDRMTVIQERDSRIISILVRSTDPQLAADIANAVAAAHVARRAQLSLADTAEASEWLNQEIDRLRIAVRDAESKVAQYRVDNDLFVGTNNTTLLDQQLSTLTTQITSAQERKNTAQSRAAVIRGLLERGQPIESIADARNSTVIQQLSQEKARLQGQLAQLSATLLSNHPTVRALNAQIAELDTRINQEGYRVAAALEAEAQVEADLEVSMQSDLARFKQTASTATQDTVALDSLQREAKAQRDLLESYLLRYNEASSRVDSNSTLPDVRVVTEAVPSVIPAFPKTALILAGIGIVTFSVQFGAVVFGELMSGRALRPIEPYYAAAQQPVPVVTQPARAAAPPEPVEEPVQTEVVYDEAAAESDHEAASVAEPEPVDQTAVASANARNLLRDLAERRAEREAARAAVATSSEEEAAEVATMRPKTQQVTGIVRYSDLAADLVLGKTHLLLLADHGSAEPGRRMADALVADALGKGLSVVLIDAGSGYVGENPGLSDLSLNRAGFGDVVQKSADQSYAEVAWGQGETIERSSTKPSTLVEALGDIYEVVLVLTGKVGGRSTLPIFADLGGRVVLVTAEDEDIDSADSVRRQLIDAGLPRVEISAVDDAVAA
ncbi:GumC family protein [Devosia sp. BK]|uniref:GumC family protein n=1 Tax=Devosia sp. BK TaxID=2871706 RepID=UPI00293AB04A|nr:GumC family protein [Devosia sp. BK]MDV3251173.1 GumC family protein [Devosia sp. BK]